MERKRRGQLREEFNSLRETLPNLKNDKASKISILKEANSHITKLLMKEKEQEGHISTLKTEQEELKKKLAILMKENSLT